MPSKTMSLIEEWKSLREESARKQDFVERLVLTTTAGNLAIFSFSFSLQELAPINAFIALLPIFLTTVAYFWILQSLYSAVRIVKYIKEIEPKIGLGWENWIQGPRRETQPEGRISIKENAFCLFYHFFFYVSVLVCVVTIWAPHWPYGGNPTQGTSGTSQFSQMPVDTCLLLTVVIVLFCIVWYLAAKRLWIDRRIKDIESLNQELQKVSTQANRSDTR